MPVDWSRYPPEWRQIALAIKRQTDWRCEDCGLQCRRPGEPFDTHRRTLTVAHINHVEADYRPENLVALCAPCHLRYDGARRKLQARARKRIRAAEEAAAAPAGSAPGHPPRSASPTPATTAPADP